MNRLLFSLLLASVTLFGQYTAEQAGPPPADLSPEIVAALGGTGYKIVGSGGATYAELWFRNSSVDGPVTGELEVSWNTVAHGTLIGAIRYPGKGEDRRGQVIQPGVYTLRFSFYPMNGAHQGLEPSRDFLILSPAAIDRDPTATPKFAELMQMSRHASHTQHPAVLSCWKAEDDWHAGLAQVGEDWVLSVKVGETKISVIVKGVNPNG